MFKQKHILQHRKLFRKCEIYVYLTHITFYAFPLSLQKTEKFLPSYETVSFAVKNVFEEFNWTEAVILATGKR